MIPESLEFAQIMETDEACARGSEKPQYEGLQVLAYSQQQAVFEWIDEHITPAKGTAWGLTSEVLARKCGHALRGVCPHPSGLQIKSAMRLCGYEPISDAVQIQHYRINYY